MNMDSWRVSNTCELIHYSSTCHSYMMEAVGAQSSGGGPIDEVQVSVALSSADRSDCYEMYSEYSRPPPGGRCNIVDISSNAAIRPTLGTMHPRCNALMGSFASSSLIWRVIIYGRLLFCLSTDLLSRVICGSNVLHKTWNMSTDCPHTHVI